MSIRKLLASQANGEVLIPALRKYLVEENERLNRGEVTRDQHEVEDARMTIETFKERKKLYEQQQKHPVGEYFHPSSLGQCIRKLFFQEVGAPENHNGQKEPDDLLKVYAIMGTGTYVHVMLQNLCAKAGILLRREVGIISKKYRIIGHADGILRIDGKKYLLEIKSQNPRWFATTTAPEPGHKRQMTAYMKCLGLKRGVLLYYDKDRSMFKEFVVKFSEAYYQKEVAARIDWHFRNVRRLKIPKREGVNPKQMPCSFCPYTHVCFGTEEMRLFKEKLYENKGSATEKLQKFIKNSRISKIRKARIRGHAHLSGGVVNGNGVGKRERASRKIHFAVRLREPRTMRSECGDPTPPIGARTAGKRNL